MTTTTTLDAVEPGTISVSPKRAAELIGVSTQTVYDYIGQGRLQAVQLSPGRKAVPIWGLLEFVASCPPAGIR